MIYVYTYRVFCTIIKGIIEIQCSFINVLCVCFVSGGYDDDDDEREDEVGC